MTYRIIFTRPAQRDIRHIGDYLRDNAGTAVARRWVEDVVEATESVCAKCRRVNGSASN